MVTNQEEKKAEQESTGSLLYGLYDKLNLILAPQEKVSSRAMFFRIARTVLAIVILVVGIKILLEKNSKVNSLQGFINSELITVRAPIEGRLELRPDLKVGQLLYAGEKIGQINNQFEEQVTDLKIKKQEVITSLEANKTHLANAKELLAQKQSLQKRFNQEAFQQQGLRMNYEKSRLKQYLSDQSEAEDALKLAESQHRRSSALLSEGFVSEADVDEAHSKMIQAKAVLDAKKALVNQTKAQLNAAKIGLQVEGSLTSSYQEIRSRDLDTEILQLKQQVVDLEKQIALSEAELQRVEEQLKIKSQASILAPSTGVIWSLTSRSRENIPTNETIIKMINCKKRWVEAFVEERDISKLYIGAPVTIKSLNADGKSWDGIIKAMRSGANRIRVGEDVDISPPELIRKQVNLHIDVDWESGSKAINSNEFCEVGSSVEVRFKKQAPVKVRKVAEETNFGRS